MIPLHPIREWPKGAVAAPLIFGLGVALCWTTVLERLPLLWLTVWTLVASLGMSVFHVIAPTLRQRSATTVILASWALASAFAFVAHLQANYLVLRVVAFHSTHDSLLESVSRLAKSGLFAVDLAGSALAAGTSFALLTFLRMKYLSRTLIAIGALVSSAVCLLFTLMAVRLHYSLSCEVLLLVVSWEAHVAYGSVLVCVAAFGPAGARLKSMNRADISGASCSIWDS